MPAREQAAAIDRIPRCACPTHPTLNGSPVQRHLGRTLLIAHRQRAERTCLRIAGAPRNLDAATGIRNADGPRVGWPAVVSSCLVSSFTTDTPPGTRLMLGAI